MTRRYSRRQEECTDAVRGPRRFHPPGPLGARTYDGTGKIIKTAIDQITAAQRLLLSAAETVSKTVGLVISNLIAGSDDKSNEKSIHFDRTADERSGDHSEGKFGGQIAASGG